MKLSIIIVGALYVASLFVCRVAYLKRLEELE